jgi:hypothetical protein
MRPAHSNPYPGILEDAVVHNDLVLMDTVCEWFPDQIEMVVQDLAEPLPGGFPMNPWTLVEHAGEFLLCLSGYEVLQGLSHEESINRKHLADLYIAFYDMDRATLNNYMQGVRRADS